MTDIARALTELGIQEWVLRGEPTTKEEFASMYAKVTGENANGMAIESSQESDWGVTWEDVSAKKDELIAAEPMRLLREERNRRIALSDWMANSDVTMTDAWKTYRQALRDITKTTPADDALSNITWPTKPE